MKYEVHKMSDVKLPFIFRNDEMHAGETDFTHWHENIELLFFYEGEGIVTVDFKKKTVFEGDLFIVNSEKLHMVESAHAARPVRYYCLIVDTDFCLENGIPVTEMTFTETVRGDKQIGALFGSIAEAYASPEEFKEAAIRVAVLNLLLTLARDHLATEQEEEPLDETHLDNVKEVIKYIKENYDKEISVDKISRIAGLSRTYFSPIFKSVTGHTIVHYINLVRCRNAAKLLRSGKYRVNDVALQCGFRNMSYFTKTYKQVMGVLPSEDVKK